MPDIGGECQRVVLRLFLGLQALAVQVDASLFDHVTERGHC